MIRFYPSENKYETDTIDEVIEVAEALKSKEPISIVQAGPVTITRSSVSSVQGTVVQPSKPKRQKKLSEDVIERAGKKYRYISNGTRALPKAGTNLLDVYNAVKSSGGPVTARTISAKSGVLYQSSGGLLLDLYKRGLVARRKMADKLTYVYVPVNEG